MSQLWNTGSAWNAGTVLSARCCARTMQHMARITRTRTRTRTQAQAGRAFLADRQHQSYASIAGLGPLASLYREGALAVTGITEIPSGTSATKLEDAVPAGAPVGSALGAGSADSALGQVVTLVNRLRGTTPIAVAVLALPIPSAAAVRIKPVGPRATNTEFFDVVGSRDAAVGRFKIRRTWSAR
ncbi:hypothetical protein [Kineosporia mesophila]|nr:hypothetical protein [Kineosporia mesophila]MCD5353271.1 hypothetical protein [Kineosporia mesophila]